MGNTGDLANGAPGARIGRRGMLGGMLGASALALAACGTVGTAGPAPTSSEAQQVSLTVVGGIKLAPDGKLHDAFSPADFTVTQNRPVQVTVYSYDDAPHSMTAPALNLNPTIAPSPTKGVPAVTTYRFTPTKAGKFLWSCDLPCDGDANGWAMANPGYMSGYITVTPA
jgi:hypothetical protein